jgi:hypothetical protein
MSALSIQQSNAKTHRSFAASDFDDPQQPDTPLDLLVATSDLRPTDHVVVIGRKLSEPLVRLARCTCHSATGVDPASLYMRKEAADVVWLTEVGELDSQVMAAVVKMPGLRAVAIELTDATAVGKLQPFLRQLGAKGLVRYCRRRAGSRVVVAASRPEWLRWVA